MIGRLILTLFHARTAAHVLHLTTKSYAVHVALNEFYEKLIPLTDSLAEAYTGAYGLIEFPETPYRTPASAEDLMEDVMAALNKYAAKCWSPQDTYLENIADEIRALTSGTLYKLSYLK